MMPAGKMFWSKIGAPGSNQRVHLGHIGNCPHGVKTNKSEDEGGAPQGLVAALGGKHVSEEAKAQADET